MFIISFTSITMLHGIQCLNLCVILVKHFAHLNGRDEVERIEQERELCVAYDYYAALAHIAPNNE